MILGRPRPQPSRFSALVELGRELQCRGYTFDAVTPATHARVLRRQAAIAADLRDVFGWNRRFAPDLLPPEIGDALTRSGYCVADGDLQRATIRFSTLADRMFVHSGFPTTQQDAVFFGPDTHRFIAALLRHAPACDRVVDVGCGSGAGGIVLADRARSVVLADVNEQALAFSAVNAALAGITPTILRSDVLDEIDGDIDLVIANPPYMSDGGQRTYRDGGGELGEALGIRIVRESLARLRPGGTLLLYTGTAIVGGRDTFLDAAAPLLQSATTTYEVLDPDVFGEQLDEPGYEAVERIAAVLLRVEVR